jgi:Lysozyme like domain
MAIAGALIASAPAHAAKVPARATTAAGQIHTDALVIHHEPARRYTVKPGDTVTAASIAMAESSGRQFATGAAGERGYWQIHPDHGSLSTYDPLGNAKAAVIISDDGRNWTPWTTFTSGAYRGCC